MILEFSTPRDRNGNRYYLGIDTCLKTYSTERGHWYSRADVIQIGKQDRRRIIDQVSTAGYERIDYMN